MLASLPAESRLFLLRTSVADVICGELADTLTGGSTGGSVLEQLSRENMMVTAGRHRAGQDRADPVPLPPDAARHAQGPAALRTPRRDRPADQAGGPLAGRQGRHAEAIRNAARAADWDFAGRVLAEAGPAMLLPGPAAELEPVLATFPASRYSGDAAVAGALAAAGLRTGDTCAAALHLDNAQEALGRCGQGQRERIRTWLQALRLMSASQEPDAADGLLEQSRAIAVQAERSAAGAAGHQGLGLLWCALGVAEFAGMDVASARESFGRSPPVPAGRAAWLRRPGPRLAGAGRSGLR